MNLGTKAEMYEQWMECHYEEVLSFRSIFCTFHASALLRLRAEQQLINMQVEGYPATLLNN